MNGAIRKMLLLMATCACVVHGLAATVANKTYFSARNELQQCGRVWAATAPFKKSTPGDRGFHTSALVFASKSGNTVGLGRYLGGSLKTDYSDANGKINIGLSSAGLPNGLFDRQIDHTYSTADGETAMSGSIQLRPTQKRLGVVLGADIDLKKLFSLDGWHVAVSMPIVQVTNNLGVTYPTSVASVDGATKAVTAASTVAQYFAGNYTQAGGNSQQNLMYGKILADDHVRSGAADMKVMVGYDIVREIDGCVELRGGLIIPFGAKPTAERLFEAVNGNGGHVGVVFAGRGDLLLWENKKKRIALWGTSDAEFTFLFSGREKRIAGIFNNSAAVSAAVPTAYAALGVQLNNAGTFPLANVLARDMDVIPSAHLDSTLGLSLIYKDFYFNFGYNMFFRKTETVDMADQWPVDRYGMATYGYSGLTAAADFTATTLSGDGDAVGPINLYNGSTHIADATVTYQIDTTACTGPDQETHQALIGAGWQGLFKGVPVNGAFFASYELPFNSSKAIRGWSLGARMSMYL
ncbi:MAG: hypothetical protein QG604_674 [Candidatus Dependentiae bacterium]|nr:hypothetical protein [Candidatus Dependentiae bacterium]